MFFGTFLIADFLSRRLNCWLTFAAELIYSFAARLQPSCHPHQRLPVRTGNMGNSRRVN